MSDSADLLIFGSVVAARLLLPLLIFRLPLPGILGCLVLDAVDQTIFQLYTALPLDGYQAYDKALDVYYLALAYIATMRNWVDGDAFRVGQFLFYYRLVGVTAFQLSEEENAALLLLFPNTFEFFFIFYELVRTRWDPARLSRRFWVLSAAGIWIFIKLPQEYWIHIAGLDTTDLVRDQPWVGVAGAGVLVALLAAFWLGVRPRLRPADHSLALVAGPLPTRLRDLEQRLADRVQRGGVLSLWLLEKVVLVSLICTIFVQILPRVEATPLQVTVSVGGLVALNSLLGLLTARRGMGFESMARSFVALALVNAGIVLVVRLFRETDREFQADTALFFVLLITLIVTVYDRYRPVLDVRMAEARAPG